MQNLDLLTEAFGFTATAVFLYAAGLTDDKKLTIFYTIGCFLLGAHLLMMGAIAGGLTTTLSGVRNIVAMKDKTGTIKRIFMFIFIGIFVYYCFNFTMWYDLLVPLASVVMSVGFIYFEKNKLTLCMITSCSLWLIFGFMINSQAIILLEVATIAMSAIRLVRQNNLLQKLKVKREKRLSI